VQCKCCTALAVARDNLNYITVNYCRQESGLLYTNKLHGVWTGLLKSAASGHYDGMDHIRATTVHIASLQSVHCSQCTELLTYGELRWLKQTVSRVQEKAGNSQSRMGWRDIDIKSGWFYQKQEGCYLCSMQVPSKPACSHLHFVSYIFNFFKWKDHR